MGEEELYKAILNSFPFRVEYADEGMTARFINSTSLGSGKRKESDIGRHLLECHKKGKSHEKIKQMYQEFKAGRREPFIKLKEEKMKAVIWAPVIVDGEFKGIAEAIIKLGDL